MTRKKTAPKLGPDPKSLTREQRELMDLTKSKLRTRSTSPNPTHCPHDRSSPPKAKRKPKPRSLPSLTTDQIAAQVSARIAELSHPTPKTIPSVKVKTHAELQSSKIARLTTKIAVTEGEIQRLKRKQVKAQEAVQRSLEVQRSAALAIRERRVALEKAIQKNGEWNGGVDYKEVEALREELESSFDEAKETLTNGRPEGPKEAFTNGRPEGGTY